ncbi:MAG: OmpA family protein [Proteobacteria bacterium]|nr:OmpA family protein [Pseudomonadota bacterium]
MRKKNWIRLLVLLVIPGMLFTVSCRKKTPAPSAPEPAIVEEAPMIDTSAEDEARARAQALEEERLAEEAARGSFVSEKVYFEFDSSVIDAAAQSILRSKAEWLQNNREATIIIEGHCDERGTNDYNLALGDRRANSVKTYLADLGIAPSRMTTISYGEERLADPTDHSKNRRAQFVIE